MRPLPNLQSGNRVQVSLAGGLELRWASDGETLFFFDADNNFVEATLDPASAAVVRRDILFNAEWREPGLSRTYWDVAPDGQRFLMVRRIDAVQDNEVIVVQNFLTELRERSR